MNDTEARYTQLVATLKRRDYRLTPQRAALLRLIATSEGHPSASDLYAQIKAEMPTTSFATVYKTLDLLKEMGEVLELGFSHEDNRYDGFNPAPHPHLVCIRCRKIIDPPVRLDDDMVLEVARQSGYHIMSHRLDFYGLCPECQQSR